MESTEKFLNRIAKRLMTTEKSIFAYMSALAHEHNAVNLGQGAPDFYGPTKVLESISRQVLSCHNQYAPLPGEARLRQQVVNYIKRSTGIEYNPNTEITITNGATEAIFCAINAFVNPGDRVVVFEPAFDLYYQAIASAGGQPVAVRLHAPDTPIGLANQGRWTIDWQEFESISASGFSLLILNSPHNPTGKIFTQEELERIGSKVLANDALVISDEVYENLVYDGQNHFSLSSLTKVQHLVIRVSSAAKTFGFTGLKVGWISAPHHLTEAIRIVHQATVFCVNPALQLGLAEAMEDESWFSEYLKSQNETYTEKRNYLKSILERAGYGLSPCDGTFFLTANYQALAGDLADMTYAKNLVETRRIATIPLSAFYKQPPKSLPWVRFAFCKKAETLDAVADLLLNS